MSPSPFAVSSPTDPASYSWEATDEGVAERFGIPISQVLRFDLNTSPAPPALLAGLLAAGRFETPLSEYPPGDYRHLVEAAADAYGVATDELVPGAGADEILDMCTKAFLPAGEAAVISVPTYPMYRIHAEQRGGRVIAVPRLGRDDGWAMDAAGGPPRPPARRRSSGSATRTTRPGRAEPDGAIERLLDGHRGRRRRGRPAGARRRRRRGLQRVQRRVGDRAARRATRTSSRSARPPRPTRSRACGSASPIAAAGHAAPDRARTGRPGSISTISATAVAAALRDEPGMRANVERVERGASAAGRRARGRRLATRSRRSPTSCCSTSSRRSARRRPRSR